MKITNVITVKRFQFDTGDILEFLPTKDCPGFSHKVIINGQRRDWLGSDSKPTRNSALFFMDKHKVVWIEFVTHHERTF